MFNPPTQKKGRNIELVYVSEYMYKVLCNLLCVCGAVLTPYVLKYLLLLLVTQENVLCLRMCHLRNKDVTQFTVSTET